MPRQRSWKVTAKQLAKRTKAATSKAPEDSTFTYTSRASITTHSIPTLSTNLERSALPIPGLQPIQSNPVLSARSNEEAPKQDATEPCNTTDDQTQVSLIHSQREHD